VRGRAAVLAIDLDTRSRTEKAARAIVRRAFAGRSAKSARILFKKIDSTLRGHLAAEIAAARAALGAARPVLLAPAFPAQGRIVRGGRVFVNRVALRGNLRDDFAGAGIAVPDAESDGDLLRIARAGLAARPQPLFVGSAGLARAIARTFPRMRRAPRREILARPVIAVVGSASPVSARQAARLSRSGLLDKDDLLVQLEWAREPGARDMPVVRRLGRILARCAPPAHYVLTGGETARAVLGALGIGELRLLGEVEPGVPFGLARDGTLICTKAGAFGAPDTLTRCVARLKREMERS
jgi:uncharacterized protein YgbK (DUF1537 family)